MGKITTPGGLLAIALLCAAGSAQAASFSTTESGDWSQINFGGTSTTVDVLNVSAINPDPANFAFDSSLLTLYSSPTFKTADGDFYLYGTTKSDFLEFQVANTSFRQLGTSTWFTATASLIASGGAYATYVSGSGDIAATFGQMGAAGAGVTGVSSLIFTGDVAPAPAPEPASYAALGVGAIGLFARRRRH